MSYYRDDTVKIIAIISAVVVAVALIVTFICMPIKGYMDVDINIKENAYICWIKDIYEQFNSKESFNKGDIDLYKELLGHTSQDIDKLEN